MLESAHVEADELLSPQAIEKRMPKVTVFRALFEHVIDDCQQRVCHGHQSSFPATTVHEITGVGLEIAVLFVAGSPGRLHQSLS